MADAALPSRKRAQGAANEDGKDSDTLCLHSVLVNACPKGMFKLDTTKLQSFQAKSWQASSLAVVVDYDLTVSAAHCSEGHHLLRDSPAVPSHLRTNFARCWDLISCLDDPLVREFIGNDPGSRHPHLFWQCYNHMMVKHQLTVQHVKDAVQGEKQRIGHLLRPGFQELLDLCEAQGVPLVILSAGLDLVITEALRQDQIRLPSVCEVLTNRIIFDDTGRCVDVEPKDPPASRAGKLHLLSQLSHLSRCSCVLLVGDKPVDGSVDRGLPALPADSPECQRTTLSFGFLNAAAPTKEEVAEYSQAFDILPEAGGVCTWEPVIALLKALLPPLA